MYDKLNAICNRERLDVFSMAVTHLLDIGFRAAEKITDEDISKMEGNGLMTQDFVQHLVKVSRDIAQCCDNPVELIQFCQAREIFDIRFYANMPKYSDVTTYLINAINLLQNYYSDDQLIDKLGMDEDDVEIFELEGGE